MDNSQPDVVNYLRSQRITKLYHFTVKSNIPSIINNGGLFSWKACEDRGISIARPGGNDTSRSLDFYRGLENYVRLSFTKNHPMMYLAQREGRLSDPVVLEVDIDVARAITTLFADRNATKTDAVITAGYNGAKNIHFSTVIQSTHFNLSPEEKEFYQAEVLVLEKVPLAYITNIEEFRPKPITPASTTSSRPHSPVQTSSTWSSSLPWSSSAINDFLNDTQISRPSYSDLIEEIDAQKKRQEQILEKARREQAKKKEEEKRKGRIVLICMLVFAIFMFICMMISLSS